MLRTDGWEDVRTGRRADGQLENSIPTLKLRFCGGINTTYYSKFAHNGRISFPVACY